MISAFPPCTIVVCQNSLFLKFMPTLVHLHVHFVDSLKPVFAFGREDIVANPCIGLLKHQLCELVESSSHVASCFAVMCALQATYTPKLYVSCAVEQIFFASCMRSHIGVNSQHIHNVSNLLDIGYFKVGNIFLNTYKSFDFEQKNNDKSTVGRKKLSGAAGLNESRWGGVVCSDTNYRKKSLGNAVEMDAASFYPSIFRATNCCFSTIRMNLKDGQDGRVHDFSSIGVLPCS